MIDLQSLRWISAETMECDSEMVGEMLSNEVKQPIEYFTQFFSWVSARDSDEKTRNL